MIRYFKNQINGLAVIVEINDDGLAIDSAIRKQINSGVLVEIKQEIIEAVTPLGVYTKEYKKGGKNGRN